MLESRTFWYGLMLGAIAGWVFAVFGIFYDFEYKIFSVLWSLVLIVWAVGHPLELLYSLPIGKQAGLSFERTVAMTLIFGVTWWMPVKKGIFRH